MLSIHSLTLGLGHIPSIYVLCQQIGSSIIYISSVRIQRVLESCCFLDCTICLNSQSIRNCNNLQQFYPVISVDQNICHYYYFAYDVWCVMCVTFNVPTFSFDLNLYRIPNWLWISWASSPFELFLQFWMLENWTRFLFYSLHSIYARVCDIFLVVQSLSLSIWRLYIRRHICIPIVIIAVVVVVVRQFCSTLLLVIV